MIGIASYLVSSPRRMLAVLVVSAVAVGVTQFAPAFSGSSIAPGAGAEQVTPSSIERPLYSALFNSPRQVPSDSGRAPSQDAPSQTSPGFSQPSEPGPTAEKETVVEVVVNVPVRSTSHSQEGDKQLVLRPTFSWVNVFSESSTIDGEPVRVGDVVTAFDPDGTLVGRFTVVSEGRFGLMALYEDDPTTAVDEGARAGDEIRFEINGIPAVVVGPQAPVWSSNGSIILSNLAAVS